MSQGSGFEEYRNHASRDRSGSLLAGGDASVDEKDLSSDEIGGSRREEEGGSDKILGFPDSSEGNAINERVVKLLVGQILGDGGRPDKRGSNGIDVDVVPGPLGCQLFREHVDPPLRRAVCSITPSDGEEAPDRRDGDDLSPALSDHRLSGRLGNQEGSLQGDSKNTVPVLLF